MCLLVAALSNNLSCMTTHEWITSVGENRTCDKGTYHLTSRPPTEGENTKIGHFGPVFEFRSQGYPPPKKKRSSSQECSDIPLKLHVCFHQFLFIRPTKTLQGSRFKYINQYWTQRLSATKKLKLLHGLTTCHCILGKLRWCAAKGIEQACS